MSVLWLDVLMDELSLKWLKYSYMVRKLGNLDPKFGGVSKGQCIH
jgi:hypothetical protein